MEWEEENNVGEGQQRESTSEDSWNTLNPFAIPYNNPELKFDFGLHQYGDLDIEDPEFKGVFDRADGSTKVQMLKANNTADAINIADRRDIFNASQAALSQDGFVKQLAMGIIPAVVSPTSAIPFGGIFKVAQTAKTVHRIASMATAGAATGAVANVLDEVLFDVQGMPTNYLSAAGVGVVLGGGIGALAGVLVGPTKIVAANALDPKNDTFTQDFMKDPNITINLDENGIPEIIDIAPMKKSWTDEAPWVGKWLRSDVHHVYQEGTSSMRSFMSRMVSPTVSMKDSQGNLVPTPKNAVNIKKEADGLHQVMLQEVTDSFIEARKAGYKGDYDQFNTDVWAVYVKTMNEQRNFVNGETANSLKEVYDELALHKTEELKGLHEELLYYRDSANRIQPVTEDMLGTIPDNKLVFKKNPEFKKLKEELDTRYETLHDEATRKVKDSSYDSYEVEFKGDANQIRSASAYRKYFQDMLQKSAKLGIRELQELNVNRLYVPRIYNYKKIKSGLVSQEQLSKEIRAGLENDVRNQGLTGKQLDIAVEGIVSKLNESAFNLENLNTSFMVKDLPFGTHLKQVKLYLNEEYMPSILKDNMSDLTGAYHYKMSGRQGLQHAFQTDDLSLIQDIIRKENLDKGILDTDGTMRAFERIVQDIAGNLRMNALSDTAEWVTARNIATANSLRLGGGFGGNQFIELLSSIAMQGVKSLMTGRLLVSLKTASRLLYSKDPDIDKFSQFLISSGHLSDGLHTSRINRYADTESGFNPGWVENTLNGWNDKLMKLNGMRFFTAVMEDYAGGAIMTMLKDGNVKPTRLARWGLSVDGGEQLGQALRNMGDDFSLDKLTKQQRDHFQLAIDNGIREIVVQGDSLHLPNWMKAPTVFKKLFFQFMRFPLIAQETLLRKGMAEEQAQMVAGVLASISTFIGIKYLREEASVALGVVHPADRKYDLAKFSDDEWLRVTMESANYIAPLGFTTAIVNYGANFSGNPEIGREWAGRDVIGNLAGPTGGGVKDLIGIITDTVGTGTFDERTQRRMKNFLPGQNLPIIKEGIDHLIEQ